jgi:hypothetical protein
MYTHYKEIESYEQDSQDIVCSWMDIAGLMYFTNIIEKKKYNIYSKLDSLEYFYVITGLLYWSLINVCDYSLGYIVERLNKKILLTSITQEIQNQGPNQDDNIVYLSLSLAIAIESVIKSETNKLTLIDTIEKSYNLLLSINNEFLRVEQLMPLTGFSQDRGQVIYDNLAIISYGIGGVFEKYQTSIPHLHKLQIVNLKIVTNQYLSTSTMESNKFKAASIKNNYPFLVS